VTPTPGTGAGYVPPDIDGSRNNSPGSWKKGLRPGVVEQLEKMAPHKGGEKENPGEQGNTATRRKGSIKDQTNKEHQAVGNPGSPPEPQVNAPQPLVPQLGPSGGNTVTNPNPNATDEIHPVAGDPNKQFGRNDGTSAKNASQTSSTATPARHPGQKWERPNGAKNPAATPTPSHSGQQQYYAPMPSTLKPPSPAPTSSP
jgi:hypothetical protein